MTDALRFAQPAPPSLSSAGSTPSTPEYFWTRSKRSTGSNSVFSLRVPDLHELALFPLHGNALEALEEADAVVAVDDRVAQLQVAQVREERLGGAAARDRRAPSSPKISLSA